MVETWRWPKASYSTLSTSVMVRPRREAVSRSTTSLASSPFSCWSVDASRSSGMAFILSSSLRRPLVQLVEIGILQSVLILRVAGAAADGDVLRGLQEQLHAWNMGELAAQPIDDLVGGSVALTERLE